MWYSFGIWGPSTNSLIYIQGGLWLLDGQDALATFSPINIRDQGPAISNYAKYDNDGEIIIYDKNQTDYSSWVNIEWDLLNVIQTWLGEGG